MWNPVFERVVSGDGETGYRVGHELIDAVKEFGTKTGGQARSLKGKLSNRSPSETLRYREHDE